MQTKVYKLIIKTLLLSIFLISCSVTKNTKQLYDPREVALLSGQLGITLSNTDKEDDRHMALYAQSSLWLGVKYRYAGLNKNGVDCSGLVYNIYKEAYGKQVPKSTTDLLKKSKKISKNDIKPGDLLFFATTNKKKKVSHVGIYLKDGYFVHASSSQGVIINHISEDYYKRNWIRNGRLL